MFHPSSSRKRIFLATTLSVLLSATAANAIQFDGNECFAKLSESGEAIVPQHANAGDIKLLARYVGTFRSETLKFDDGKTEYFFTVNYGWFDKNQTVLKFHVTMEIPSQKRALTISEGFYGYDPFSEQLYVFGVLGSSGAATTGWGAVAKFDRKTGERTVWAKQQGLDGVATYIRDHFEFVNENAWKNTTLACTAKTKKWEQVHQGIYTRVTE